jgi:hypothetical protein
LKYERRISNVQHRTSNIDDAALYRFLNKRTEACDEPFGHELKAVQLPSTCPEAGDLNLSKAAELNFEW